jgi:hypothetical protein
MYLFSESLSKEYLSNEPFFSLYAILVLSCRTLLLISALKLLTNS